MADGRTFRRLFEAWRQVLTDPAGFFQEMPVTGGLGTPLAFLAACAVLFAVGIVLVSGNFGWGLGLLIWAIVKVAIGAAIIRLAASSLFDGQAGYEATFRACSYAAAPIVFLWIPVIQYFAALYLAYLLAKGIERVNGFRMAEALLSLVAAGAVGACVLLALGLADWIPAYPIFR